MHCDQKTKFICQMFAAKVSSIFAGFIKLLRATGFRYYSSATFPFISPFVPSDLIVTSVIASIAMTTDIHIQIFIKNVSFKTHQINASDNFSEELLTAYNGIR